MFSCFLPGWTSTSPVLSDSFYGKSLLTYLNKIHTHLVLMRKRMVLVLIEKVSPSSKFYRDPDAKFDLEYGGDDEGGGWEGRGRVTGIIWAPSSPHTLLVLSQHLYILLTQSFLQAPPSPLPLEIGSLPPSLLAALFQADPLDLGSQGAKKDHPPRKNVSAPSLPFTLNLAAASSRSVEECSPGE